MTDVTRGGSGLLVVDVQRGVVAENPGAEMVVPTITRLVGDARAARRPVVWVQHDDADLVTESDDWRLADGLVPGPQEPVVRKQQRSAFAGTGLAGVLHGLHVDRVVLVGVQSAFCVDLAGKHALAEGFDVTMVSDGHANGPLQTEAGLISDEVMRAVVNRTWRSLRHPGRRVEVVPADQVTW